MKEADKNIKQLNHDLLNTFIDSSPSPIVAVDTKGRVALWNNAAEKTFGWKKSEIIGKANPIIPKDRKKEFEELLTKSLKGENVIDFYTIRKCKNGADIHVSISVNAWKDKEQNVIGRIAQMIDITEQLKAENELRESKDELELIFNSTGDALFMHDLRGGMIKVNDEACRRLGYTIEELLNLTPAELDSDRYKPLVEKRISEIEEKKSVTFETEHVTKNGAIIPTEIKSTLISTDNKKHILSIARDISERKKVEAELKESEKRFRNAVVLSPIPIMIHDEDDNVIQLSSGWTKYSGYTLEDIPTLGDWTEKAYGSRSGVEKEYINNLSRIKETANNGEWQVKCKNGEIRIWDFFTTPLGTDANGKRVLLSIAFDITNKKKAEEELKHSEEKYREFFEKDLTGDFLSTVDGKMIDCNPAFVRMLGYNSPEEIKQHSLTSFYKHKKDRDKLLKMIKDNKVVNNYELSLLKKDGTEINVIENVIGEFNEKGNLTHLRGYIFDITDRKIAEERFQQVHSLLYAIRNVNQLIVTEKNIDTLMQHTCKILMESRGYSSVWIGLTNDQNKVDKLFHNGFGRRIYNLSEQLKKGIVPGCIALPTLENPIIKSESVEEYCKDCVMKPVREGKGVIVSLIKHLDNIYGVLYIITENIGLFTEEEESLIEEVSGDLGLAIFIQQEEQKRKTAETRLQNAMDTIPEVLSIVGKDGRIKYLNKTGRKIIKAKLSDLTGGKVKDIAPEPIRDIVLPLQQKVFETKLSQQSEAIIEVQNEKRWFYFEYFPLFDENGDIKEIFGTARDITESKAYEQKFIQLAEGVASKVGEEFFDVLVENLSKTLNADVVLIGKIDKNNPTLINTVSVYKFAKHPENFFYNLVNTPCENVVGKELISHEKSSYKLLPKNHPIAKLKMEGYIGTPLFDSQNNPTGILVCLFKEPIENIKIKESIVHVFGLRAAAEIERLEQLAEILKQRNRLEESEDKFRTVVESAFDGIYIMEDTHYEYVNRRFCELTGYTEEELTSLNFDYRILLTEKSLSVVEERYKSRKQGEAIPQTYEMELKSKDGKINEVEVGTISIGDKNQLRILGFIHNITELKQAFKKIKESETRFRSITQSANDAIITVDSSGKIIGWNPSAEQIFGFSEEEILNKPITTIIPEEYLTKHIEELKRVESGGEHHVIGRTVELKGLHKNGTIFPLELSLAEWEASGEKFYTGIIRNISERKRTEEEIKKLSAGVEQSSSSIVITDVEGNIEYINKKFTEITGYTSEDAIGKNPRILKSDKNDPNIYKELWATIKSGKEWHGELCNKKKSGELFWESESISPIVNTHGKITHFIAIKDDITEHKKLVEELREAKIKAEAADKMKSEFLAQMSHEIRSPLNAVLNFTNLIKEETSGIDSEVLEIAFPAIESSSKRIIRTVDMILNMSDIQTGTYNISSRSFNLTDLLENLVKEYKSSAQHKNLLLNFWSEIDNVEVETDDYAVTQIFANLIDNAIKYTDEGFIEIRLLQENNKYIIEVEDSGIGISEEYLPDLFSPFSQEEHGYSRKFDGTGLGLSLVKKYCELTGADISVKSKKNAGTTFTVTLPK